MAKSNSVTVPALSVPQDAAQAASLVHLIGANKRALDALMNRQEAAVAAAAEKFAAQINDATEALGENVAALQAYAEANKDALTADGKRSVATQAGTFGWRYGNRAVKFEGKHAEKLIEKFKELGHTDLIRTIEQIDKTAILANPDAIEKIKKIKIEQEERFYVRPLSVDNDIAGKTRKLKGKDASFSADADDAKEAE